MAAEKDAGTFGLGSLNRPANAGTCLRLTDRAVATSGDYFRSFTQGGRATAIFSIRAAGEPVSNGCQAVTVIAPTCATAGILATAAFILGPREGWT